MANTQKKVGSKKQDFISEKLMKDLEELNMYRSFCTSLYAVIYIVQLEPYRVLWVNDNDLVKEFTGMDAAKIIENGDVVASHLLQSPDFEESVVEVVERFKENPDVEWAGLYRIKDGEGNYNWIIYTASTMTKDENGNALTASIIAFPIEEIFNTPKTLREFQKHLQLNINKKERDRLTEKQKQILIYMAQGFSRKEIAHKMDISIYTLDDHKKAMLKKLKCKTTQELIRVAQRLGLMIH